MSKRFVTVDGNEAAAWVAHQINEVIAIYPITPASPMGEHADAWSAVKRENIFGTVPEVIEMQSEGGAAAACHGSLQGGALTTTFTASQGLLLMIPDMFKIAGELTPTVFHIAARTIATHALSIFGDHSDVMATRSTGWGMLCSGTIQEVQDFAMIAQMAALKARLPFLHFFDGFRTSHEVNKIEQLDPADMKALIDLDLVKAHRERALNPDNPFLRGSAQNPDVFFQGREAINPTYAAAAATVQEAMDRFAERVGRSYHLFEYVGDPQAESVIALMGSGIGAAEEAVAALREQGRKIGVLKVRLYRPFDTAALLAALPASVKKIATLDRTKEPGATGEPLYQDVVAAIAECWNGRGPKPLVVGGRYGLSSKEFTPAMVKGIFDDLDQEKPHNHFSVGIVDDVSGNYIPWDESFTTETGKVTRAVFYGLGSDGTVGANKNSVKIIGENTPNYAQGYFVYDSKKAGSITISHLRFAPEPVNSAYLIHNANFVACHQFTFLQKIDVLALADPGATFLLNSPFGPEEVWDKLPIEAQRHLIEKKLKFYVIDGARVAKEAGMGGRINTAMQACFFALSGVLPREEAIARIKDAIEKTYGVRGEKVLKANYAAVDGALEAMHEVRVPAEATSTLQIRPPVPEHAPEFVQKVTGPIIAGKGDDLPVSAMPIDGTFPTGTASFEKRGIAPEIPIWDPEVCTQCALCAVVCPHAAIRIKPFEAKDLASAPASFQSVQWKGKELPEYKMCVQVAPDDCTGCSDCVDVCPAKNKEAAGLKAINMRPYRENAERERANFEFFLEIPELDRTKAKVDTIKGSQVLQPLFEFSGACAGCGETPYVKLMSQLFGDRALVANATGCSSIYGGNLPTTPWTQNRSGRGPAWSNSLFEDNAEFGLGIRLAVDKQRDFACHLVKELGAKIGDQLAGALLEGAQIHGDEAHIEAQRERVAQLKKVLAGSDEPRVQELLSVADSLVQRSVWIIGGDGWAYDIGFGGLDHVLASGRNVNLLVLDTEVYSNTGGQASKATPRAAVAKFAAGGKPIGKKDLGMIAMAYGNVYVAQVALGANPLQTIRAFNEAESYKGTSIVIAYSHCIAHGIAMNTAFNHQKEAVQSGFWPIYRYDPRNVGTETAVLRLDSRKPKISFREFAMKEGRFAMLARSKPEESEVLFGLAQKDIDARWQLYEQMSKMERS